MLGHITQFTTLVLFFASFLVAMEQEVTIRAYNPDSDRKEVKEIFEENPRKLYLKYDGDYSPEAVSRVFERLLGATNPNPQFRSIAVLSIAKNILGFSSYYFFSDRKENQGYVETLTVTDKESETARAKYEKDLLNHALAQLKSKNADKAKIHVFKNDSHLINLIKEFGFTDADGKPTSAIADTAWELEHLFSKG